MDNALSERDRVQLLGALTKAFPTPERLRGILTDIGYPSSRIPGAGLSVENGWRTVLQELDAGLLPDGYRSLLRALIQYYPANPTFQRLATRYAPESPPADPTCHLLLKTEEHAEGLLEQALSAGGVTAHQLWNSETAALYRLNTDDIAAVEGLLGGTDLKWNAIPPGAPTYLVGELIVQGPDGQRFRLSDVPAQQTVGSVAQQVVGHYLDASDEHHRPTVVDRLLDDGRSERLDPEATLDEAGILDGASVQIGFEARAGAVNPGWRDQALVRAQHQMTAFALDHPEVVVTADLPRMATCYEVEFDAPGFGPPPAGGTEPVPIDRHVVQIRLGADFPVTAPVVFWVTEVFHPNVFPNYDCAESAAQPSLRGLVCLGELAEAYGPALDFGRLCQSLRDLAGYRNYSLFDTEAGDTFNNFFDRSAAAWAGGNQDRIVAIGGRPLRPAVTEPRPGGFRPGIEAFPA
ncbi:effector-associated domain EAD1-containing protein [Actinoplanes sp. NPDC049118]|uniref:effector-associated domain EAD1-containing protein n=1 Tax=Actinoplanes sp. NPDC049118 TaxID=3155769 RepID=UPI0033D61C8A